MQCCAVQCCQASTLDDKHVITIYQEQILLPDRDESELLVEPRQDKDVVEECSSKSLTAFGEHIPVTDGAAKTARSKGQRVSFIKLFSQVDAAEALVLAVGLVSAVCHGSAHPFMTVILGDFISTFSNGSAEEALLETERLCLMMCLVGGAAMIAATLQGGCFKIFCESQTTKFRIMYFQDVLHQDVSWFDTKEVSALPAEIENDLSQIQDGLGDKLGNGIMAFSAFAGSFGVAFSIGWQLGLVLTAMLPLLLLGSYFLSQAYKQVQMESQAWYSKSASVVEECLYGIRTVVAFGGEQRELARFTSAVTLTRKAGIWNGVKMGLGTGYCWFMEYANYALAFFVGMTFAYNRDINPGTGEVWKTGDIMPFASILESSKLRRRLGLGPI